MSKIVQPPSLENSDAAADAQLSAKALSSDALARRRMLLKSLSKGSAVVAATALPIHSLAAPVTIGTTDNTQCTVSGMGSAIHSNAVSTGTCKGSRPSVYADPTSWPGYKYNNNNKKFTFVAGGKKFNVENATFRTIFGARSTTSTLKDIMAGSAGVETERVWIAALFNAEAGYRKSFGSTAQNFPYSPVEVVNRYQNTSSGPEGNSASYLFFRDYLQSL